MKFYAKAAVVSILGVGLVAGASHGVAAAPQSATSTATQVDDSTLKTRITEGIKKDASLAAREVDVAVDHGVVILKGTVKTAAEKTEAARIATVHGVARVQNDLVVDAKAAKGTAAKVGEATKDAAQKTGEKTKEAAEKTAEKTKEIAGKTANATKDAVATTGEAITDGMLTAKVKTKFADETLLKGSDINVDTDSHVVTLRGTTPSLAAKTRAETIAQGTEGVKRVVNLLVVKP